MSRSFTYVGKTFLRHTFRYHARKYCSALSDLSALAARKEVTAALARLYLLCLVHESHLRRVLNLYKVYYNKCRCHLSLDKNAPIHREMEPLGKGARIVSIPHVGGLHHRYTLRAGCLGSVVTRLTNPVCCETFRALGRGERTVPHGGYLAQARHVRSRVGIA